VKVVLCLRTVVVLLLLLYQADTQRRRTNEHAKRERNGAVRVCESSSEEDAYGRVLLLLLLLSGFVFVFYLVFLASSTIVDFLKSNLRTLLIRNHPSRCVLFSCLVCISLSLSLFACVCVAVLCFLFSLLIVGEALRELIAQGVVKRKPLKLRESPFPPKAYDHDRIRKSKTYQRRIIEMANANNPLYPGNEHLRPTEEQ
jgi:hypothetical protein